MAKPDGITRYNCTVGDKRGEFGDCMEKSKTGRWVTFEQHTRQINSMELQIQSLINKLKKKSS